MFIKNIPGSVIGMVLFFVALCLKIVRAEDVRGVCKFLLGNMALFFVPVGVGVMASAEIIGGQLGAIVVSGLVSTVLVMAVVGWTAQWMEKRRK